jgi:uncharacterized protein
LKSQGIEPKDIQTSALSLAPRYSVQRPGETNKPRIIGYMANNDVRIRIRELPKLGSLLDKVVAAGANEIRGVTFDISQRGPLLDEARRRAVADAKHKAVLYAESVGVGLGPLVSLTEESGLTQPQPMRFQAVSAAAATVPVEAGEMTLRMRVRMVWSLAAN